PAAAPAAGFATVAGWTALACAFFAPGLFAGAAPVSRALLVLVIPMRAFARDALRRGELPLWNPHLFFGAPFLANYQSAVLYPPSALIYLLPFPFSLSLFLAFHVVIAGVGMTIYLRRGVGLASFEAGFGGV